MTLMDATGVLFVAIALYIISSVLYSIICGLIGKGFVNSIRKTGLTYSGTWVAMVLAVIGSFALFVYSESHQKSGEPEPTYTQAASAPTYRQVAGNGFFGCVDKDYFHKLMRFRTENDGVAFSNSFEKARESGLCTMFIKGEPVFLSKTEMMAGLVQIRRKGDDLEYWTFSEIIH
ncbi:hypothetical protein [Burkholderia multivorans]|uniref:hypothetical protein n=1 Tax=Burkholderia multivorans TaxID=87883 RepID=UPI0011B1C7C0|nr:hypothetical protein [Burkholderia multivorans]